MCLALKHLICALFDNLSFQFLITTYTIGFNTSVLNAILSVHFSTPMLFTSATHFKILDLITIEISGEAERNTSPPYAILYIFLLIHPS